MRTSTIRLISLHFGSQTQWTEKCHGQRQVVWRLRVNGGGAMRKVMITGFLAFAYVQATQVFFVAPATPAVQNEGHSTVVLPIQERSI